MRLLVSLCNLGVLNSQFSLVLIGTDKRGRIDLINCASFMDIHKDTGINGICRVPDGIAVAIQSNIPRVMILDNELKPKASIKHPHLSDLHSLHLIDGELYCVCTGNNKVLKINLDDHSVTPFWEYHIDEPCLHMNSFGFHRGRPIASSHSFPKEAKGKGYGGVWYLDNYEVLIPELKQPHTMTIDGDVVHCLSSADSRIVTWRDGALSEHQVRGYLRGMLIKDDEVYIAASSRRFLSRKQAGINMYVDFAEVIGNKQFMSNLVVCDRNFIPKHRTNTTHVGFEFYDVMEDPGIPESLRMGPPAAVRMQALYRQIIFFREQLQSARRK